MKKNIFAVLSLLLTLTVTAQGVKIGDTQGSPDGSAMLEVEAASKGFLPPRMTTASRDAISNPANGLLIFNTTTRCYEGYDGAELSWYAFGCLCTEPTKADAGVDQNIACNYSSTILAGNTPVIGTGQWSVVSGTATITNPASPTAAVTGLTVPNGIAVLRWTISNGSCVSYDDVTISTCSFDCGVETVTDIDGHTYNTVLIGNQCWMKENLNTGTYIAVNTSPGNNGTIEKHCQNLNGQADSNCPLGGLYQWNEMMNYTAGCNGTGAPPNDQCANPVRGICPVGWHIPSHYEWTTLEKNVGTDPDSFHYNTTDSDWKGIDEGGNLKATNSWNSPNTGATNSSGFTALPGGYSGNASFGLIGSYGGWWCSTENTNVDAWRRLLNSGTAKVYRYYTTKANGYTVRCIKD